MIKISIDRMIRISMEVLWVLMPCILLCVTNVSEEVTVSMFRVEFESEWGCEAIIYNEDVHCEGDKIKGRRSK
jgi:hypothetical protein